MADFNVTGPRYIEVPLQEYLNLLEISKQKAPIEEEAQEGWLDTLSDWGDTAVKVAAGLSITAAAGYGLYYAGASVGAEKAAEFCEQRITQLLQTGVDIGNTSPSILDTMYNVGSTFFGRVGDGLGTAFGLYVAKDYVPSLVFGAILGTAQYTVSAFTTTEHKERPSSWTWTATKVISAMSLMALAGYGMYCAGVNAGAQQASKICEEGVSTLLKNASIPMLGGTINIEGPASGALVAGSNSLASPMGTALALPFTGFNGTLAKHVYNLAMENLPSPDLSVIWDIATTYTNEKYDNLKLALKVVGGAAATGATIYVGPSILGALKFGARAVRFVAFRR